jgi:hypothetical protein
MSTPFLDGLSTADRELVAARSRGAARPSYVVAGLTSASDVSVQISEDFEAFLIILSPDLKKSLLQFLSRAAPTSQNDDETALIAEVVSVRSKSYEQTYADVGRDVDSYDATRAALNVALESASRSRGREAGRAENVMPDLSALSLAVSEPYQKFLRPEGLVAHDRITDAGVLYRYQNVASRVREIASWQKVLSVYLF